MSEENVWTINRCLTWTRDYLARKGDEHARLSAEWLLSAATGKDRTGLYMAFDEPLSADELTRMHGFIERRAKGRAAPVHHRQNELSLHRRRLRAGRPHPTSGDGAARGCRARGR